MSSCFFAIGQEGETRKADKKFSNWNYIDAVSAYEAVVKSGYESEDVFQKLGDAYYFNAQYAKSVIYYKRLFKLNEVQDELYLFRYGQSLKAIKNYDKADVYLSKYYELKGIPFTSSKQYVTSLKDVEAIYEIEKTAFNSKYSEYPGFLMNDELFVIAVNEEDIINSWNGEPTSDVFKVSANAVSSINAPNVNSKYNEGSLVITKDGNTMYFTRNNYLKKVGLDSEKAMNLKLYKATKENGEWDNIVELPFNSDAFSVGHPALSTDESTLFFVSDMEEGSQGGTDIYSVTILENDTFGNVTNITSLNTDGNEMFPFMAENGKLYFSSNGYQNNIGGLDIYSATIEGTEFTDITNLGEPINSSFDDFAFVATGAEIAALKGYFASNRKGAESDDIYSFTAFEKESDCDQVIAGIVKDKKTGDYLPFATVSLIDANNEIVDRMVADELGRYSFENKGCDEDVKFVRADQQQYQTNELALPDDIQKRKFLDVYLDLRELEHTIGTDIGLLFNPIYFDLDKSFIRSDAAIELQKIISLLNQYPQMKIDVRSHTDSRADDAYNLDLSDRRAKATIAYLIKNGIDSSRLSGRGYGETQLINGCSNGVDCTSIEHQLNRRSEFIIVE